MATVKEKLDHFLQLFGDSGQEILAAANQVQKEADSMGVEFKEASDLPEAGIEALKARKKKKVVPPADDDEDMEEGEELDVEEDEEEVKALDDDDDEVIDDATEDYEIEDEVESPAGDDEFFPLGEVDVKEFGAMLADVMVQALSPVMTQLKELRETKIATKEFEDHQADGVYLAVTAAKEHEDRLGKIEAELASTRKELVHARKRLKELGEDMPKAFGGFVASEAAETELSEADPRLKEAGPKADPLGDFVSQFVMPNFK